MNSLCALNQPGLVKNLAFLRTKAPHSRFMVMLKANAYGNGALAVAKILQGQVEAFAVARLSEALALRQGGIKTPILVLSGENNLKKLSHYRDRRLWLTIHSMAAFKAVESVLAKQPMTIWIKLDTGMHRLGLALSEAAEILPQLQSQGHRLTLFSHLANADVPDHPQNAQQADKFFCFVHKYQLPWSLANSAALLSRPEWQGDWVRPGIALYGGQPFAPHVNIEQPLEPVQILRSPIMALRKLPVGESVGYGSLFSTQKTTCLATVPLGYGDGFPRQVPQGLPVKVITADGIYSAFVAGRVSMDLITLDVSQVPNVQLGDWVEFWGKYQDINQVAHAVKTIPYTLMTQINQRPERAIMA